MREYCIILGMAQEDKTKIIVDATADFPPDVPVNQKITRVGVGLTLNDVAIPDSMSNAKFLEELAFYCQLNIYPKTSAQGPFPFLAALPRNNDAVIITAARAFSRLKEDAMMAAEKKPVLVVEGIASIVNGWMAMDALEEAEKGKTGEEIAGYLEKVAAGMRVILALDTMEYLREGGRAEGSKGIRSIAYALGAFISLKPVVEVTREGLKAELNQVQNKSRDKSLKTLKKAVMGLGKMKKGMWVHAGAEEEAAGLAGDRELLRATGLESIAIIEANKYVISHIGPLAIAFCGETAE